MSLINDALKRAKQAHQENPAPAIRAPDLRPVEPQAQPTRPGPGLLVPIGLAVVAIMGLLLVWVLWKKQGPAAEPPSAITAAARTPSEPVKRALAAPADNAPVASEPAATNTTLSVPGVVATNLANTPEAPATNHPAAVETVVPPGPPPFRLQSIVFSPRSPSALINGRVVFVGDRVRDLRVTAIHRDEVVLSGSRTNLVLSLDP